MAGRKPAKTPSGGGREARSLWNNPVKHWTSPFGKTKSLLDKRVTHATVKKVMREDEAQDAPFSTPVTAEALDQSIS